MDNNEKASVMDIINTINAVDGFDPTPLAVDFTDMNTGEKRKRLPVIYQIAWFRLKYPEGRFMLCVTKEKDRFVATARVYKNYMDPIDCYLSEATASRGDLLDKPTVSPREWAQTAALGIALRNAGFGLQFHAAGESFDDPNTSELGEDIEPSPAEETEDGDESAASQSESGKTDKQNEPPKQSDVDPLDVAMKMPCPISKYNGKTLGDMVSLDPKALIWVAEKFTGDPAISTAAKMICEHSLQTSA